MKQGRYFPLLKVNMFLVKLASCSCSSSGQEACPGSGLKGEELSLDSRSSERPGGPGPGISLEGHCYRIDRSTGRRATGTTKGALMDRSCKVRGQLNWL